MQHQGKIKGISKMYQGEIKGTFFSPRVYFRSFGAAKAAPGFALKRED
jgi:hypothetical protein